MITNKMSIARSMLRREKQYLRSQGYIKCRQLFCDAWTLSPITCNHCSKEMCSECHTSHTTNTNCPACTQHTCKTLLKTRCSYCHSTGHATRYYKDALCTLCPSRTTIKVCCQCAQSVIAKHNQEINAIKQFFVGQLSHPSKIIFEFTDDLDKIKPVCGNCHCRTTNTKPQTCCIIA
jgi:hypothetical protein